ncbi:methylenetetrahydrofolate reductase [Paenibacillus sp. N4]|uniref:methylenetetrahydrofolate reductase n=1 Tax=Paenibacillus vietnamensis TaxID=2590547 RepID=UPI001CD15FF3|nr:methylenetetrahydrofolate reductase [Paenibacillus vietnamensis]MCA0757124.1 methylenetetrahydrofolate reductase [Paenibacillus vietnamensis]
MRISIELVPRDEKALKSELSLIKSGFPSINTINIPDLTRFDLRSWDAACMAKSFFNHSIPHIRAMDFDCTDTVPFLDALEAYAIKELLVVTGDVPKDGGRTVYPTTCVDLIAKLKKEHPHLKVYAAIDQYRGSIRDEYEYVQRKLDAGADGFFTQPFFDLRLMELYAEMLAGTEVFWGVSPVVSEKSQRYWETRNRVVFPIDFAPTLEWNIEFSRRALAFTKQTGNHIYFMPIKVDLEAYLEGVFEQVPV